LTISIEAFARWPLSPFSLSLSLPSLSLPPRTKLTSSAGHRQRRDQRDRREDASVGARHFFAFPGSKKGESGIEKLKRKEECFKKSKRVLELSHFFLFFSKQRTIFSLFTSFFQQRSESWCRARCAWPSYALVSSEARERERER
jgi:hypothetical protein